jgi:hypothetical protein
MLRFYGLIAIGTFCLWITATDARPIDKNMLPDEGTAKKVGETILESYIGSQTFEKSLERGEIKVLDDGDAWVVFLIYKIDTTAQQEAARRNEILIPHGMRMPELHLSKRDGRVIDITLSRD